MQSSLEFVYTAYEDVFWVAEKNRILENLVGLNIFQATKKLTLETSFVDLVNLVTKYVNMVQPNQCNIRYLNNNECVIQFTNDNNHIMGAVHVERNTDKFENSPFRTVQEEFTIATIGDYEPTMKIFKLLEENLISLRLAKVTWWYTGSHGVTQYPTVLPKSPPVYDEFYPYIKEGVDNYINRYLNSSATILFMFGAPGTGKTSFIRHLLQKHELNAMVTHDEKILSNDEMYVSLLVNKDNDMMIVEDADTMLGSRELEGNKLISRFLNASDGLIKFPNKKMIFTVNLTDMKRIDSALLRPGRCFDVMNFRELTAAEASAAALKANLPFDGGDSSKKYTLAELFNKQPNSDSVQFKVGFI